MDTDSNYMALREDKVEQLIGPEVKLIKDINRGNDCIDDCRANEQNIFLQKLLSAALEIRSKDTWSYQRRTKMYLKVCSLF